MARELERPRRYDPRPDAYAFGAELFRLLAEREEATEEVQRQTSRRRTYYRGDEVAMVEEEITNERITRRSYGGNYS
ncbi:hypothetical protein OG407_24080 [Streptomyces sp. NBC_01515]|uniref:hypothetical protein n=1 Tax=Streptomyces sp. NBC_01515 TaxID=2903890 RepID=UPI0038681DED